MDNTVLDVSSHSLVLSDCEAGGNDRGTRKGMIELTFEIIFRMLLDRNIRACCTRSLEKIVSSALGLESKVLL